MFLFTEHELKKYRTYLLTVIAGVLLCLISRFDVWQSMGIMFTVLILSDVGFNILGRILARILFKEVIPKSVKELKHSDKQYQYVLNLPKRDVYSYVYTRPLDKVKVRCWEYMGSYMIGVTSKKEVKSNEKKA